MTEPNVKPIVHYSALLYPPMIGQSAVVVPTDHQSPLVSNTKPATTSKVVKIHGVNEFETVNTIYRKVT